MSDDQRPVLFIYAHPDDMESLSGGTGILLAQRRPVHTVCLTHGDGAGPGNSPEENARLRTEESELSARLGGWSVDFLDARDGQVVADAALIDACANLITEREPAAVVTHWPMEKLDHAGCGNAVWMALWRTKLIWSTELYFAAANTGVRFEPDVFVNIESVIERKIELLAPHVSQFPDVPGYCREWGRRWGQVSQWGGYAEGFRAGMPMTAQRWDKRMPRVLLDL